VVASLRRGGESWRAPGDALSLREPFTADLFLSAARTSRWYAMTSGSGQEPQPVAHGVSDATGAFELTAGAPSSSASTTWIYITASGGQTQTGNNFQDASNTAIELVAMLGSCANLPAGVTVNELTTIAAAYALNAFITGDAIAGGTPGFPNATQHAHAACRSGYRGARAGSLPNRPSLCRQCAAVQLRGREQVNSSPMRLRLALHRIIGLHPRALP